ncbi:MAG: hypothetical protein LH606_16725 [Cytophagaceae bacterium]|nr:hypothetical protein [Cytophagaceae bacterium]
MALMTGAQALTTLYGANYKFTDNSYNLVGFSPRSFNSFEEAAIEGSNSRIFAGIHYRKSCNDGLAQGKKIVQNINSQLKFKK